MADEPDGIADPTAMLDALERRERDLRRAAEERGKAGSEEAGAARLLLEAGHADGDRRPRTADAAEEAADRSYDSAEHRRDLAASLEGHAGGEAIEARAVADTSQARPAREAVAQRPQRVPAVRRARGGIGRMRVQPRQPQRAG
jgi:hypothetical protein